MIPLILFILLTLVIVILFEIRERLKASTPEKVVPRQERPDGCCGEHLVCERETLLQTNAIIEYYDDEELDALSGIPAESYTPSQIQSIQEVFNTLKDDDIAGWCRSMQLRNIAIPADIRDEALMIVRERRNS